MRRVASIAVLIVLLTSVLVPLAQGTASSVPACCRIGGQHHCSGMAGADGFHSQASACPYRVSPAVVPGAGALPQEAPQVAIAAVAQQSPAKPSGYVATTVEDEAHKRGPPLA
jgi:hypothetical protein